MLRNSTYPTSADRGLACAIRLLRTTRTTTVLRLGPLWLHGRSSGSTAPPARSSLAE
jgi:hypothetical protein